MAHVARRWVPDVMGNESSPATRSAMRTGAALCALAAVVLLVVRFVADAPDALLYAAVALALVAPMLYVAGRRAVPPD